MFIVAGLPCSMRINGIITRKNGENLPPADTSNIVSPIYQLAGNRDVNDFEQSGDDDFLLLSRDCHVSVSVHISKGVRCPL